MKTGSNETMTSKHMQDVFTKKFEHTEKFKFQRERKKKIKGRKRLTVVVCKSENVQKKVPHTTNQLTGKIAQIFQL